MALTLAVVPDQPEESSLALAAQVIQAGGVIVYPTETLYGIGANALNPRAIARVHQIKGRGEKKPILVLVQDANHLVTVAQELPPSARSLIDKFWPGPLTLVLKAATVVPQELNLGSGTIGVRVPGSPLCRRLLALAGCPITSTSANMTGERPLTSVQEIRDVMGSAIDLYLDAGTLGRSLPSTLVDLTGDCPRLLREGAISRDALLAVVPSLQVP